MKKGDSPVMIVYPPDDISDESVYAISEFLHEICRAFEQHYHRRITRHMNALERDARDRAYTGHPNGTRDEEDPF
jgi:hypothetical protein